jgi:iron(III) transport system ATP-binding protein
MQPVEVAQLELQRARGGFRLGPLSFRLEAGSRTALIGPSGCGKSTLLRCLAGLERPRSGRIRIGDHLVSDGAKLLVGPERRRIGFVFQDGALWPHLDAVGHLRFVQPDLDAAGARALLDSVGLADKARRRPAQLSGGEAQRLALARALAGRPEVLLLDEPLGAVDVHLRDELALLVRRIAAANELTMVVVTHDRDEALSMADDVIVLRDGQLVERGTAAAMVEAPRTAFSASFLGHAVCLPIRLEDGRARTSLGPLEPLAGQIPAGERIEDRVLAVLPGDLETAAPTAPGTADAEVLQVRTDSFGRRFALVVLDGQTLPVPCDAPVQAGARIGLRLRRPPRILPRFPSPSEGGPSEGGRA